jgi:hypothetical protein
VEADYTALAESIGLAKPETRATLASALAGAKDNPRQDTAPTSKPTSNGTLDNSPATSQRVQLARTHKQWAEDHGATVDTFTNAKWEMKEHNGRPAWLIPHKGDGITRVHFIDGEKPKAYPIKPEDYKGTIPSCWYGFEPAIQMAAKAGHKTIVLCNGQPSVVVGQSYGVPAIAQTSGEKATIALPLFKRLLQAIREHKLNVLLAYDGDDSGRKANDGIQKQFIDNDITPQVASFGGNDGYDLADHCKLYKDKSLAKLQKLASFTSVQVQPVTKNGKLSSAFSDYMMVTENNITPGEYLVTPFKSMHALNGYAYMLEPGKVTGIIAPSGYGKTSWIETWAEWYMTKGIDIFMYSPEWSAIQMHWRRIQRNGGASYDQIRAHGLWHNEEAKGIPDDQKFGVRIEKKSDLYAKTLQTNKKIKSLPGQITYFEGQRVTGKILEMMTAELQLARRVGKRVGLAVFDYAQLLRTVEDIKGKNSYEIICDMIKDWSIANHIHSIVGVQVTKERAHGAITQDKLLTEYDASWIRPDVFNLILSLNIQHIKDAMSQELKKLNTAKINVCKNSTGETGVLRMRTDFKKLRWIDQAWR